MTRRIDRILSGRAPHRAPRVWQRLLVITLLLPTAAFTAADNGGANGAAASGEHPAPTRDWPPSPASKPGLNADGAYIVAGPNDGLEPWYPVDAKRKGLEGRVSIAVTLDTAGRATDTQLLSEFPEGAGFGAAASAMAHSMTYANPSGHTTTLVFMVKFELDGHHPGTSQPGTTNFETGEHYSSPAPSSPTER